LGRFADVPGNKSAKPKYPKAADYVELNVPENSSSLKKKHVNAPRLRKRKVNN
jgi:hypothetical protein